MALTSGSQNREFRSTKMIIIPAVIVVSDIKEPGVYAVMLKLPGNLGHEQQLAN